MIFLIKCREMSDNVGPIQPGHVLVTICAINDRRMIGALPPSKFVPKTGETFFSLPQKSTAHTTTTRSREIPSSRAMQETRDPTTKLSSTTPVASTSPPPYYNHYGTFSPPPPPPVAAAAYSPALNGCGAQSVVAFPCTAQQQQVFAEGLPVREPRLPFCGVGLGWALFLLGFFLAAIPWYTGAFLLFFVALDHREKPGLIACTIAGIFALVPLTLNGIRMHPFW